MAFGGVLIIHLILTIVMLMAVSGVLCNILGMVFALIHFVRQSFGKPRKGWMFITSCILILVGFVSLIPFFILLACFS